MSLPKDLFLFALKSVENLTLTLFFNYFLFLWPLKKYFL